MYIISKRSVSFTANVNQMYEWSLFKHPIVIPIDLYYTNSPRYTYSWEGNTFLNQR